MDLIYTPRLTPLLRQARAAGADVIGGLGMLVHQGAEAFSLWTGATGAGGCHGTGMHGAPWPSARGGHRCDF